VQKFTPPKKTLHGTHGKNGSLWTMLILLTSYVNINMDTIQGIGPIKENIKIDTSHFKFFKEFY
jgi:hypothetical protein